MRQDAVTRNQVVTLILDGMDKTVTDTWNKLVDRFVADNLELTEGKEPMFHHAQVYYPLAVSSKFKTSFLRKNVPDIHEDLLDKFQKMHKIFIKDYQLFYGKFKSLLSAICRQAQDLDTFNEVLPSCLMKPINNAEVSYVPVRTAKGWGSDEELEKFINDNKEVIERAVYYSTIGKLT